MRFNYPQQISHQGVDTLALPKQLRFLNVSKGSTYVGWSEGSIVSANASKEQCAGLILHHQVCGPMWFGVRAWEYVLT